ncbi:hypothetical protein VNI00_004451 [Paramarasmius palmivorus]|uniref:NACHT-NTPase and P-loop NTPases N-terminal domain-containing protein n=1 Tax=Paramarasmius palmivorus TaxID=297713 RepID=A0AAW0DIW0_9AGAR
MAPAVPAVPSNMDDVTPKTQSKLGKRLSVASDISMTVLTALKEASLSAPIPYVGIACALALEIATAAQGAKDNKDAFKRLAKDTCSLVLQINAVCSELAPAYNEKERQESCGSEKKDEKFLENEGDAYGMLSPMLHKHLDGLKETLIEIREFVQHRISRTYWRRYVASKSDLGKIQEFRDRIRQALDVFGIQSHITVRENLDRIAHRQESMHDELKTHWGGVRRDSPEPMSPIDNKNKNPFATDTSPSSPDTASSVSFDDAFKGLLSSSTISGTITFNNIKGDSHVTTNNVNNSSSNCGNTYHYSTNFVARGQYGKVY